DLGEAALEALHDDVGDHPADSFRRARAENCHSIRRQVLLAQQPGPYRIIDIVVDIRDDVGDSRDLPFDRAGTMLWIGADWHAALPLRVPCDAVSYFPGQVEPRAIVFEDVDDPEALFVMIEAARDEIAQHALSGMPERRVTKVVPERDGFGEFF